LAPSPSSRCYRHFPVLHHPRVTAATGPMQPTILIAHAHRGH
jgi:hypothetical protein